MNTPTKRHAASPLPWYGGKTSLLDFLLPLLPAHENYIEVFGGSGALLLAKAPAQLEVYNDIDPGLGNFMKTVKDAVLVHRLIRDLQLTPHSREEYLACKDAYSAVDAVEWARQFFVLIRQARSAVFKGSWRYGITTTNNGFHQGIPFLLPAHSRLKNVLIRNDHFRDLFEQYDHVETLWYLDPPYLPMQRRAKRVYQHEMTHADHVELLGRLLDLKGKVVLSGYPSQLYSDYLSGWVRHDKNVACYSSPGRESQSLRKPNRVESVWLNPAAAVRLTANSKGVKS